jgi:hypothetical protein
MRAFDAHFAMTKMRIDADPLWPVLHRLAFSPPHYRLGCTRAYRCAPDLEGSMWRSSSLFIIDCLGHDDLAEM